MTTPATPPAAPSPEHEGFLGHVRAWFGRDVEPRLAALEADVAKVKALAPQLSSVAATVEALVKTADPAAAPDVAALVAGAEKAAAVIRAIATELGAAGL
jgi:hypothetical protein